MINSIWISVFSLHFFMVGLLFGFIIPDPRFKKLKHNNISVIIVVLLILFWPISIALSFLLDKEKK